MIILRTVQYTQRKKKKEQARFRWLRHCVFWLVFCSFLGQVDIGRCFAKKREAKFRTILHLHANQHQSEIGQFQWAIRALRACLLSRALLIYIHFLTKCELGLWGISLVQERDTISLLLAWAVSNCTF
jgi:hypothetical protein